MKPNLIPPSKRCLICNKLFQKKVNCSKKDWLKSKFCSRDCKNKSLIDRPSWNKGVKIDRHKYPGMGHFQKHTKESLELITKKSKENAKKRGSAFYQRIQKKAIKVGKERGSYKGTLGKMREKSSVWKGNKATYNSIHRYIQNHWYKTGICQRCNKQTQPFGKRKKGTEWHNLDGKYDRDDRSTWQEVCVPCHKAISKGEFRSYGTI